MCCLTKPFIILCVVLGFICSEEKDTYTQNSGLHFFHYPWGDELYTAIPKGLQRKWNDEEVTIFLVFENQVLRNVKISLSKLDLINKNQEVFCGIYQIKIVVSKEKNKVFWLKPVTLNRKIGVEMYREMLKEYKTVCEEIFILAREIDKKIEDRVKVFFKKRIAPREKLDWKRQKQKLNTIKKSLRQIRGRYLEIPFIKFHDTLKNICSRGLFVIEKNNNPITDENFYEEVRSVFAEICKEPMSPKSKQNQKFQNILISFLLLKVQAE